MKKWWNNCVMKPIKSVDSQYGFSNLREFLLKVLLRRTKDQKVDDLPIINLPPRDIAIKYVDLAKDELQFYQIIENFAKSTFDTLLQKQNILKNYAHILELLLKLRQACDHPYLVNLTKLSFVEQPNNENSNNNAQIPSPQDSFNNKFINTDYGRHLNSHNAQNEMTFDLLDPKLGSSLKENPFFQKTNFESFQHFQFINDFAKENNIPIEKLICLLSDIVNSECEVCMSPAESPSLTSCLHIFCSKCLQKELSNIGFSLPLCPSCGTSLSNSQIIQIPKNITNNLISFQQNQIKTREWRSSAKIESLLEEIKMIYLESDDIKCIIFSQWTSMLDLIEIPLQKNGFKFVRLDGSVSQPNRQKAINNFNKNNDVRIFLISTKAGGIGLNLIAASRVFILDPWWNYACESQAIDRVHRVGQTKPVKVIRFIVKDSIEEQILKLQERKQLLAQASFGSFKNKEQLKQIRIEELKLIFNN